MSDISRQEFQRRRQALVEQMQPGSAALIFAAPEVTRSADSEYPYRQNSDFWYFTGFNEPEAVLVLIKSEANTPIVRTVTSGTSPALTNRKRCWC